MRYSQDKMNRKVKPWEFLKICESSERLESRWPDWLSVWALSTVEDKQIDLQLLGGLEETDQTRGVNDWDGASRFTTGYRSAWGIPWLVNGSW